MQTVMRLLSWLVTVLVPVALLLTSLRLVMLPWFLEIEYRTPNFPPDRYGFTVGERLKYSRIALDYLLNDQDISFLGELQFPSGQRVPDPSCQLMEDCSRIYNERELEHMVDVKIVAQAALKVWFLSLGGLLVLGLWAWFGKWWGLYRIGLRRGGWLTVGLLCGLVLFGLLAFGTLFVWFHQIFFEAGTWVFYYSDTLIRLFPQRFWRDIFLLVGLLTAGFGLALGWGLKKEQV